MFLADNRRWLVRWHQNAVRQAVRDTHCQPSHLSGSGSGSRPLKLCLQTNRNIVITGFFKGSQIVGKSEDFL